MPEFQLDTSGSVEAIGAALREGDIVSPKPDQVHGWRIWSDLDAFTQGYIEALFFTWPEDEGEFVGGITSPGFSDLAPETLAKIIEDCARFQRDNFPLLDRAYAQVDYDATQAGRDLWLTRCGHGVGYWSRDQLDDGYQLGVRLSDAANAMGCPDAYLGDDGKVYLS